MYRDQFVGKNIPQGMVDVQTIRDLSQIENRPRELGRHTQCGKNDQRTSSSYNWITQQGGHPLQFFRSVDLPEASYQDERQQTATEHAYSGTYAKIRNVSVQDGGNENAGRDRIKSRQG